MSAAAEKVKHYGFALATVYMCYFTYGIQALILSQNKVNFYTQWGITDPTAGSAAVSMAIAAMGFGKLLSVWIGGELSDRVGRKKFAVAGAVAYIICFTMMLLATDATACYIAAFLSGVATSGFWDAALYPAAQEAEPKYAASGVIGIKAAVSVMGVIYPIFVAAFSAPHIWHVNIYLPIVLSVVCLIMTIITPFRYDDERATKTDGDNGMDEAQAEIQAAKDAMLKKPGVLVQVFTLVMAFICMFIMYGAQQYTKAFGMANLGLDEMGGAALASIYTVGSITAVFFWAVVMGKLRWNPLKVLLIDFAFSALALALVLVVPNVAIVYVAIALLGFFAAGGALQTGLVVRQNYCPGPKGRNTGMYMTFMGVGATFLPFIVGAMTTAMGETGALYTMMGLLLAAAIVGLLFCIYLAIQSKPLFGYGINRKMDYGKRYKQERTLGARHCCRAPFFLLVDYSKSRDAIRIPAGNQAASLFATLFHALRLVVLRAVHERPRLCGGCSWRYRACSCIRHRARRAEHRRCPESGHFPDSSPQADTALLAPVPLPCERRPSRLRALPHRHRQASRCGSAQRCHSKKTRRFPCLHK